MALDVSGSLLEGIRLSQGNDPFSFPPRNFVTDQAAFDAIADRAEYVLIAASTDPSQTELDVGDPNLRFLWTRNDSTVFRFDYDSFSRRWLPAPGGPPQEIGIISNSPRLAAAVPDPSADAPFDVYVGSPVRVQTFTLSIVDTQSLFTDPALLPEGTVEQSREDGVLNFSQDDVDSLDGSAVLYQRQGFFDRTQTDGSLGVLPQSSAVDYVLFLNPRPGSGQSPRVRIGFQPLLTAVEVADEASLGTPASGTFTWALDTGRIRLSPDDVDANPGRKVYYDGITQGEVSLTRISAGAISAAYPSPSFTVPEAVGITDPKRLAFFAELAGQDRSYFQVTLIDPLYVVSGGRAPRRGNVLLDTVSGLAYFSFADLLLFAGWTISYVDTVVGIEDGVSVQVFRSGVNTSGFPQAPDFRVTYSVDRQILQNSISGSPFVFLPTNPLEDDVLEFQVVRGPSSSGSFVGALVDGTDPDTSGLGYVLDQDLKQLSFSNRKTTSRTIRRPTATVKLEEAAISELGFEVTRNGSPLTPGTDFDFDPGTGLLEFLTPVGANDPDSVTGIVGAAVLPNGFVADDHSFAQSDVGKYLFISAGDNRGIYEVTGVPVPSTVTVTPPLRTADGAVADLVPEVEVVADRFWTELRPPYKKFTLSRADSPAGPFVEIPNTEFTVFKNTGQVNLSVPARPGEAFQVTYVAVLSTDGVNTGTENRVENALFKVRQEQAEPFGGTAGSVPDEDKKFRNFNTRTVGTRTFRFNPEGKTVNVARDMVVYVNGVPLDPDEFTFEAPDVIRTANRVGPDQVLILDYWVEDAVGGETNFNLLSDQVDLDTAEVVEGEQEAVYNGDQTGLLTAGSGVFIDQVEVLIVESSIYDPVEDVTNVTFESVPTVSSDGAALLISADVASSRYRTSETAAVDVLTQSTNVISVLGDRTGSYVTGTVVTVDGDPYSVLNSSFDPSTGRTLVTISAPAKKNYLTPSLTYTVRPILFPGASFQTSLPASIEQPFTLVRMGAEREILLRGVDYDLADGGIIELTFDVSFGDELVALYVGRELQPVGTTFTFNYAYAISPDQTNGIAGQRLQATYNLYAPDTFFYRVETVETFLPEVVELLQSSASTGAGGPNTADATGPVNKDFGSPSLYFEEQHQGNFDVVMARLVKFYNDVVNLYEDLLSNVDGRIVGGNQGRFRFDGSFDNPLRDSFEEITNDIDDVVKLYDTIALTGFFTFDVVPVYGTLASPSRLSRIFPTIITKTAGLNDQTGFLNLLEVMGSFEQEDIRSVSFIFSTPARSFFDSVTPAGTSFTISKNGDVDLKLPPFAPGQDVDVYSLDGVLDVSATVLSVSGSGPYTIVLDTPANVKEGSLLRNVSDAGNSENHFYSVGRDLLVDFDNGNVINMTFPPPLDAIQNGVEGEELVDGILNFGNTDMAPRRIPALDGSTLNDDGRVPAPLLRREGETILMARTLSAFKTLGSAVVAGDQVTVTGSSTPVEVGQEITWLNGPNAGQTREVLLVVDPTSFILASPVNVPDPGGSDFLIAGSRDLLTVLGDLLGVLETNVAGPAADPDSKVAVIDSEIRAVEALIDCYGTELASGTGSVSGNVLTDGSASFVSAGSSAGNLLFIPSGANRGLYLVSSVTDTTLEVDPASPFVGFPSAAPSTYSLIRPEDFLDPVQFGVVSEVYRETLAFIGEVESFLSAPTDAGKVALEAAITARQSEVTGFVTDLEGILVDGGLYDVRYLWIDQRTNKREGTKSKQRQAAEQRVDDQVQLVADQQKLLIAEKL